MNPAKKNFKPIAFGKKKNTKNTKRKSLEKLTNVESLSIKAKYLRLRPEPEPENRKPEDIP